MPSSHSNDSLIKTAAALISGSRHAVAFTGAGMSTESGIPDFRSPGGIWTKYDPEEFSYQNFISKEANRKKYWRWSREFYPTVRDAKPNAGHLALAELESRGLLHSVITQNIDDLHRRAGNRDIIELHGNGTRVGCLMCGKQWSRAEFQSRLEAGDDDPRCDNCNGLTKPRTISFGQSMPEPETTRAFEEATRCDLLITVGSSLVVFPAATLVPTAKESGARLILINLEPTPYDAIADVVIHAKAGESLSAIVSAID